MDSNKPSLVLGTIALALLGAAVTLMSGLPVFWPLVAIAFAIAAFSAAALLSSVMRFRPRWAKAATCAAVTMLVGLIMYKPLSEQYRRENAPGSPLEPTSLPKPAQVTTGASFALLSSRFVKVGDRPAGVRPFRYEFEFGNVADRTFVRVSHKVVMVDYRFANLPKQYPGEPSSLTSSPNTGFLIKVPTLIQGKGEPHYVVIALRFSDARTPNVREEQEPVFMKWEGLRKGSDGHDYLSTELDSATETEKAEIIAHLGREILFPPN